MKTNIATTQSQSDRLLRCGVSADTADMSIRTITEPMIRDIAEWETPLLLTMPYSSAKDIYRGDYVEPAWSLSALLSYVLPKHLDDFPFTQWIEPFSDGEICEIEDDDERVLNGDVKLSYEETAWIVDYDWDGFTGVLPNSDNPIEACVRAIELLYANGYNFTEI